MLLAHRLVGEIACLAEDLLVVRRFGWHIAVGTYDASVRELFEVHPGCVMHGAGQRTDGLGVSEDAGSVIEWRPVAGAGRQPAAVDARSDDYPVKTVVTCRRRSDKLTVLHAQFGHVTGQVDFDAMAPGRVQQPVRGCYRIEVAVDAAMKRDLELAGRYLWRDGGKGGRRQRLQWVVRRRYGCLQCAQLGHRLLLCGAPALPHQDPAPADLQVVLQVEIAPGAEAATSEPVIIGVVGHRVDPREALGGGAGGLQLPVRRA